MVDFTLGNSYRDASPEKKESNQWKDLLSLLLLPTLNQTFICSSVWNESSVIQRETSPSGGEPEPGSSNWTSWTDRCLFLGRFDFRTQGQTLYEVEWKVPALQLCLRFTSALHQLIIQVRIFWSSLMLTTINLLHLKIQICWFLSTLSEGTISSDVQQNLKAVPPFSVKYFSGDLLMLPWRQLLKTHQAPGFHGLLLHWRFFLSSSSSFCSGLHHHVSATG